MAKILAYTSPALDPTDAAPGWLASIDRPVVLITTSSEKQGDDNLVATAMAALADEPVHVIATVPAGEPEEMPAASNATVCRLVPHALCSSGRCVR